MQKEQTYYQKIGRRYFPLNRYDIPRHPANGLVLVKPNGWTVLPTPPFEVFNVVEFGRIFMNAENLTIAISDLFYDRQFALDFHERNVHSCRRAFLRVLNGLPKVENVPVLRRNDNENDARTCYVKKSSKYVVAGMEGGFKGFQYNGLYLVKCKDGATHEESVTYLAHLRSARQVFFYDDSSILNKTLESLETHTCNYNIAAALLMAYVEYYQDPVTGIVNAEKAEIKAGARRLA